MTFREAITTATAQLSRDEHLRESAARDAEFLLMHQLGINRAHLLAYPDRELTREQELFYWQSIHRRSAHEPIQYITDHQEFYGHDFHVTPAVLIPRPETEHLVEAVLQELPHNKPLEILDVGTGSGILAVMLALHLPYAEVTAVDISAEALAVARRNAEVHGVANRIRFIESDLLAALSGESFDAIVSNPPYIPDSDRSTLHPQVREYEPATALFAGETGLDIYRRLIQQAWTAMKSGGLLAMEMGYGQRDDLASLLSDWQQVSFVNDLQQISRIVLAHKPDAAPKA